MISGQNTIYAKWPTWAARFLIVLIIALSAWPLRPHAPLHIPGERQWNDPIPKDSDAKLYSAVVARIEKGENYYDAAAAEQRARGYPTSPAQVFREPALAILLAALYFPILRLMLLYAVFGASIVLLFRELLARQNSAPIRILAVGVAATGLSVVGVTDAVYWHEVWAALLIALSLFCYRKDRWLPSVVLAVLACLIRELAMPYLLVMAFFSLLQRRWAEFFAWLAAGAVFLAAYVYHLKLAGGMHADGDIVSASWLAYSGWDFVIATAKWNNVLHMMPDAGVALAICFGVVALAGAREDRTRRACITVSGYMLAFMIVGRPDNYYWGILYTPLLAAGFLFFPAAARDIYRRAISATGS